MNSVVCIIGYFVLILAINVGAKQYLSKTDHAHTYNYGHHDVKLGRPFLFGYYSRQSLNMTIIFKNIPSHVSIHMAHTNGLAVYLNPEEFNGKMSYVCSGVLNYEEIWLDAELRTESGGLCARYNIIEGINLSLPSDSENAVKYKYYDHCFNGKHPCEIEVDLTNVCQGNQLTVNCYRESKKFVCKSQTDLTGNVVQTWYHDYGKQYVVSMPSLFTRTSKYIMTFEKFDHDTEIYSMLTAITLNISLKPKRSKIYLYQNESGEYSNVTTLKYGLSKELLFDCRNYLDINRNVQIGFINTANRISTFDKKWVKRTFDMTDNGTIMCCLLYVRVYSNTEQQVERFVEKKTRLIYDELLDFVPSVSDEYSNVTTLKYGLTKELLFDCRNYVNVTEDIQIGLINTVNQISTYDVQKWVKKKFDMADNGTILCCLLQIIFDDGSKKQLVKNKTIFIYDKLLDLIPNEESDSPSLFTNGIIYIIIASALVVIMILFVILMKKYYRNNPNPEESHELHTNAPSSGVLYAELDIVGGDGQRIKPAEESTYAEIIGVLNEFKE